MNIRITTVFVVVDVASVVVDVSQAVVVI